MATTSDEELEFLRRRADALNLYVNRHRSADRSGGDLYIQPKKKFRREQAETLRKFVTAAQVWSFLENYAA